MPRNKGSSANAAEEDISLKTLDNKLNRLLSEMGNITSRLTKIEENQREYENSLTFLHQESSDTKAKVVLLETAINEFETKLTGYKTLDAKIEAAEYQDRAKCVELNGIEYTKDECLMMAFDKIIAHLSLPSISSSQDIDKIFRIRKTKRILIKFVHTNKRDTFFNAYRKNIMSTKQVGFQTDSKVYINEVLSVKQRELFWKTRGVKNSHNYKYVWTFAQRIFLRKTAESDAIQINNEGDLDALKCM